MSAEQLGAAKIGVAEIVAAKIEIGKIAQLQTGPHALGAALEKCLMQFEDFIEFGLGDLVLPQLDIVDRGRCQTGGGHVGTMLPE